MDCAPAFSANANPASVPAADFTGGGAESVPMPSPGNQTAPYRDLSGQWCDGVTGEPFSPAEVERKSAVGSRALRAEGRPHAACAMGSG